MTASDNDSEIADGAHVYRSSIARNLQTLTSINLIKGPTHLHI